MRITPIEIAGASFATMGWYSGRDHMKPGVGRFAYRAVISVAGATSVLAVPIRTSTESGWGHVQNASIREQRTSLQEMLAQAKTDHSTGNQGAINSIDNQTTGDLRDPDNAKQTQLSTGTLIALAAGILGLGTAITVTADRKIPKLLSKLGVSQPHTLWGAINVLGLLMSLATDEKTEFAWK